MTVCRRGAYRKCSNKIKFVDPDFNYKKRFFEIREEECSKVLHFADPRKTEIRTSKDAHLVGRMLNTRANTVGGFLSCLNLCGDLLARRGSY